MNTRSNKTSEVLDSIDGGMLMGLNFMRMKFFVENELSLSSMHELSL